MEKALLENGYFVGVPAWVRFESKHDLICGIHLLEPGCTCHLLTAGGRL